MGLGIGFPMNPKGYAPAFVRPAVLEAVLASTLGLAALLEFAEGSQLRCTALVQFALFSAIAAASAGLLFFRYAIDVCGLLADYRGGERWGARVSLVLYAALCVDALANGLLDLMLPRHDADPISFVGLYATLGALVTVTLVIRAKFRALADRPSRSLLESLADDSFFLQAGIVTVAALFAHLLAPAWWIDTVADGLFAVLTAQKVRRLFAARAVW